MLRLKRDSYCSGDECANDLFCWESKCRKICTGNKVCPDQLPCTIIDDGVAVCFQPQKPIIAASASGTPAVSQDGMISKIWLILIIFGCMLFLCFLLYLVMKIVSIHTKRRLVDPEAASGVAMQVERQSPAIAPKKLKPAPPRLRMSSLRVIPEGKTDHQENTDDVIASVDTASSPSVQSVKVLWEQRGKLIAPNIPTIETAHEESSDLESHLDEGDKNAVALHENDDEEAAINRDTSRYRSRNERY